jgi:hypothetical protein
MTDIKVELPGGYKPKAVGPSRGPEASNRVTAILPEDIASKDITESIDVEISVQVNGASTVTLKRGTGDKNVDDAVSRRCRSGSGRQRYAMGHRMRPRPSGMWTFSA